MGELRVESEPDKGSTFTLGLPLTQDRPVENSPPAGEPLVPSGSERVLIVEDDPAVLSVCLDMLNGLGYRCEVAMDAAGALQRLETDRDFDLLFSDVVMPGGVNGIELARRARDLRPNLKVLLTSGYIGENSLGERHDFEVIDKPYQRGELAERLRAAFKSSRPPTRSHAAASEDAGEGVAAR